MARNGISEFGELRPKRFVNGHVLIRPFSEKTQVMLDPNRGTIANGFGRNQPMRFKLQRQKEPYYNPSAIRVEVKNPNNYTHIKGLYDITRRTTTILSEGLRELQLGTDEDTIAAFKEYIARPENVKVMAEELNALRREIGGHQNYHVLEVLHFLNEFSGMVSSIDHLIKGKEGSSPGFIATINNAK